MYKKSTPCRSAHGEQRAMHTNTGDVHNVQCSFCYWKFLKCAMVQTNKFGHKITWFNSRGWTSMPPAQTRLAATSRGWLKRIRYYWRPLGTVHCFSNWPKVVPIEAGIGGRQVWAGGWELDAGDRTRTGGFSRWRVGNARGVQLQARSLAGGVLECTLPCFCHETEIRCSHHAGGVQVHVHIVQVQVQEECRCKHVLLQGSVLECKEGGKEHPSKTIET